MRREDAEAFSTDYAGAFLEGYNDPLYLLAFEECLRYEVNTESYDRAICTGPIKNGEAMPRTASERAAVIKNASLEHRALTRALAGVPKETTVRAWRDVRKFSFEEQRRILAEMPRRGG